MGIIFDSYPRISTMREFEGFHERGGIYPAYIQREQVKIKIKKEPAFFLKIICYLRAMD